KDQIYKANKILGIKKVFTFDLPDNRFDSVDFLDIFKIIEEIKNKLKPEIIFIHSKSDLNIDHRITHKAVITAARPVKGETVKSIYAFEVLSSTEWNYPLSFSPNVYFNIENTLDLKLKAMSEYKNELREYPHPRSLEGIKIKAKQRGMEAGFSYAEAFELIRIVY
ncbi:MAG TPA: PIG-L family deacetylase, partial [Desulfurobacteriaceae bacterium]|nr:PIG-L family deacetylase [Desulfurobacteriaceae bacterium]